ncbi:MAG: hypothetical protein QW776_05615 [Candidatus Nitrosocaldus sp.]
MREGSSFRYLKERTTSVFHHKLRAAKNHHTQGIKKEPKPTPKPLHNTIRSLKEEVEMLIQHY